MTITELQPLQGERQSGESESAVLACNDWLRLGPGRTIPALLAQYQDRSSFVRGFKPPSTSKKTLETWSSRYSWPERAREYDAQWDAMQTEERERELAIGLALDFERVRKLKRLADFLEAQIYELSEPDPLTGQQHYHNVWCPDVKVVGHGDAAEAVDIERFNSALFTQYRETLNDLAKEVGGRVQKQEMTGKDGAPIKTIVQVVYENAIDHDGDANFNG